MRIAIAGGTGLIGSALQRTLRAQGHDVLVLTRGRAEQPGQIQWDPGQGRIERDQLGQLDALVNLAGAPIARRWTSSYKDKLLASRLSSTTFAAQLVAEQPGAVLVNGSAVGYYGSDRPGEVLTETSAPGQDFIATLTQQWEAATAPASQAGNRVAIARTGIALDPHALVTQVIRIQARLRFGGPLGPGDNSWPWISLYDHVRALIFLIENPVDEPANLTAPISATQRQIFDAIARASANSHARFAIPEKLIRLAMGEAADEMLGSREVRPTVLEEVGFEFTHRSIDEAARWLVSANRS